MAQRFAAGFAILLAATPVLADAQAELEFARSILSDLQGPSFRDNVEYCGYIGLDDAGNLVATEAVRGGTDWCDMTAPQDIEIVASYHTHAGYDPNAWSEIPSGGDMESDEDLGIDGYVSTPGGRLWYIDTEDMIAFQVCGIGCLQFDPRFQPAPEDNIQQSYTYNELVRKIGN
ncbi:MAG: DUF4329 domain-containing protein [Boseongicola sp.]|nr:DUF4329 domain-containing protein [Boseongicola sp.]